MTHYWNNVTNTFAPVVCSTTDPVGLSIERLLHVCNVLYSARRGPVGVRESAPCHVGEGRGEDGGRACADAGPSPSSGVFEPVT